MEYDELLRVHNNTDQTIEFRFASRTHRVKPNQDQFVPFEAVVISLGDPRSGPQPARIPLDSGGFLTIPGRKSELRRLSTVYGTYDEENPASIKEVWNYPHVTVTNMEGDEPIVFPADDPECSQFDPMEVDQSQMAALQRQAEKMRRQLIVLEQQVKGAKLNEDSTVAADQIEEDTPSRPRVTARS